MKTQSPSGGTLSGKNILVLNGSPRKQGNTVSLANHFSAGAKEVGAMVEMIYLHGLDIRPCDACDFCQEGGNGCVISDDMQEIYPRLRSADVIVIACPVYWFSLPSQIKLCIDRWYALETPEESVFKGKSLALLMVYGDADLYSSGGINIIYTLDGICRYEEMTFDGIVHGTALDPGDAEKNPLLVEQAFQLGKKLGALP